MFLRWLEGKEIKFQESKIKWESGHMKKMKLRSLLGMVLTIFIQPPYLVPLWQAKLSDEEKSSISGGMTEEEIKATLWSLKAYKASSLDGLHAGFFQRFWLIVGSSIIEEVKRVFVERKVPSYLNKTHIALISKIQGPETLGNYKPISLCNIVYKIVTKVIIAWLRPYLDKLISPLQATFVPGRKGIDNAIIAQEVIHSINKKRGKVGYMALKIDLEKVYNKLEWSFIKDMLIRINLLVDLVNIIMSCVSTVFTSILVNGDALESIYPSRDKARRFVISIFVHPLHGLP